MESVPYTCTGTENPGNAELFDADGNYLTAIYASRCYADWWTRTNGWTWRWRDGVDPDDPTTWPGYEPPEEPPTDSE